MGSRRLSSCAVLLAACVFGPAAAGPALASQDPLRSDQWGLGAVGAPEAWERSAGGGVVVAVIDTGVQVNHPDLAGNVWTNPGEVANGIDDDGNGFIDDVHGANMLTHRGNVTDESGHGTHVAGIIAARAGNGIGGSGLAPRARIMPVKVFGSRGEDYSDALERGVRYAVSEGAKILNVSVGTDVAAPQLTDAVRFAGANGATVVAGAGNDNRNTDSKPVYPASLPDPAVLSITARGIKGRIVNGVNYGRRSVDLAAPGDMILSTVERSRYELRAGTSMAAPFAAGALALLAAARPDLSQAQLRKALLASATRTRRLAGKVGAGGLDVGAAMHRVVRGHWGRRGRRNHRRS